MKRIHWADNGGCGAGETVQTKSKFLSLFLALTVVFVPRFAWGVEWFVTNKASFTSAMSAVQPGDVIAWKNGTYDNQSSIVFEPVAQGTSNAPITLRPETPGGVIFRGNTQFNLGGHYLVVTGFRFDNSNFSFSDSNTVSAIINFRAHSTLTRHAYNCRVTQCAFASYDNPVTAGTSKWFEMYGSTNRFDHNSVSNKVTRGAVLIVELSDTTNNIACGHRIDHNVFADRPYGPLLNEYETVRVGTSSYSEQNARVLVDRNYFWRCSGEAEFVSNKSCENSYLYNTFVECYGSLTLRHGRGCRVEGNIFLGNNLADSGGIRISNRDHVIVNNYLQDLTGLNYQSGLAIMDGTAFTTDSNPDLSGSYVQVSNVVIAVNTLVNVAQPVVYGVGKGGSGRTNPPLSLTLAANIISATSAPLFTVTDPPAVPVTYLENIIWGAASGLPTNPELIVTDPLLVADAQGIRRPATDSPAIGAAGTQSLLPGNLLDMDGALRPLNGRDIGADQVGFGARPIAPQAATEVGPFWMRPSGPLTVTDVSLIAPETFRISIRSPGTTWAQMLTLQQSSSPDGPWTNLVGGIAEADDDGVFAAAVNASGQPKLFWRVGRP
jgi:poly(beta-D-mannuronate) lyase